MSESSPRSKSNWTWILPLAILAGLVGLYFLWPEFQQFVNRAYQVLSSEDRQRIEAWVAQYGAWGFVVIYALMLMQTIVPILPSVIAMVASVLAFGPVVGALVAWSGMLLAASLGYAIGAVVGPVTVDRLLGGKAKHRLEGYLDRYGFWAIIAARISPVLSTDAVSIVAGLVRMKFLRFVAATALGTLPLTLLIAYLGEDIERLETGLIWLSVVSVAVFIAYVLYDRRKHPELDA